MSVHKLIFPGILVGIMSLIGITSLLSSRPGTVVQAASVPEIQEAAAAAPVEQEQAVNWSQGGCSLSQNYPDSIRQWCGLIEQYANENNLDPNLISAVMLQESAGHPDAYSKSGAVGLMQVMPRDGKAASFVCKNGPCFADRPSMNELFDPEYNVAYGANMLAGLINYHGNVRDALKAYGPKDVGYYYADLVLGIANNHQ
jgi:soluble lytic murein transglycosylase-like protein